MFINILVSVLTASITTIVIIYFLDWRRNKRKSKAKDGVYEMPSGGFHTTDN